MEGEMDLPELQQGLENIQQADIEAAMAGQEQPWLNKENFMNEFGPWFGNDPALGELLLGQMNLRGADTRAATEAALRAVLQGLVDDMNFLQGKLADFVGMLRQQTQQTQAVTDSIQAALDMSGADSMSQLIMPPEGMPIMNDMAPDMGTDMGVPADVPPEAAPMPPPEAGSAPVDMPPPEVGAPPAAEPQQAVAPAEEVAPPAPGAQPTPSDRNIKTVHGAAYTVSDIRQKVITGIASRQANKKAAKHTAPKQTAPKGNALSRSIIDCCSGGF